MEAVSRTYVLSNPIRYAILALVVAFSLFRLCHIHLLWADEDYHLAASINILHGKLPYRDFWYDKPPLDAAYYLLIGGHYGWPLRFLDAAYILLCCYLVFRLVRSWWGEAEAHAAAFLLAFFTTFYLPSAVIPFAADALMIAPHLAAISCAYRKRPAWAGFWAGIGFLVNIKAVFVLLACAVFLSTEMPLLLVGFALPVTAGLGWLIAWRAWNGYVEQVWRWGVAYAKGSPVSNPFRTGLSRTADWVGFHAAAVLFAAFAFRRLNVSNRVKLGAWLVLSFVAVSLGSRFAPHYFFQLLPPVVVVGSRGLVLALQNYRKPALAALVILLAIPFVRFAPRYASLAADDIEDLRPHWSDVVMDLDSQQAAAKIRALGHPGDTLFVWGYRPDLYVYTRMVSDSLFWDSQPLTGVPADRHLSSTAAIYSGPAAANRRRLATKFPTFIADGLTPFNPRLKIDAYPELRAWFSHYHLVASTKFTLIYRIQ